MQISMNYKEKIKFITWNVRGLNERDKRLAVRQTVFLEKPDIVCFQETKLRVMDDIIMKETCGRRLDRRAVLDAQGTRGGILIGWRDRRYQLLSQSYSEFCLTVQLRDKVLDQKIQFTGVYGPTSPALRPQFFQQLDDLKPTTDMPWIVCGDFNVTLYQEERNSKTSDWRWPLQFAKMITDLGLHDMKLQGRKFTWSNSRDRPSMAKLDRFLISTDWASKFPNGMQRTLPNSSSDHCPVTYSVTTDFSKSKIFRFENYLLRFDEFRSFIEARWLTRPIASTPLHLHQKILFIQEEIKQWEKGERG